MPSSGELALEVDLGGAPLPAAVAACFSSRFLRSAAPPFLLTPPLPFFLPALAGEAEVEALSVDSPLGVEVSTSLPALVSASDSASSSSPSWDSSVWARLASISE